MGLKKKLVIFLSVRTKTEKLPSVVFQTANCGINIPPSFFFCLFDVVSKRKIFDYSFHEFGKRVFRRVSFFCKICYFLTKWDPILSRIDSSCKARYPKRSAFQASATLRITVGDSGTS